VSNHMDMRRLVHPSEETSFGSDPYRFLGLALQAIVEDAVASALASVSSPAPELPVMVSVPEAARRLGLGTTKVKELIACGRLASVTVGRRRLVPTSAIIALADHMEQAPS
jgi:excisionase family DNA binding protein